MTFKPIFTAQEFFPKLQAQKSHVLSESYLHLYVIQTLQLENIWSSLFIPTRSHSLPDGETRNAKVFLNSILCLTPHPTHHPALIMPPPTQALASSTSLLLYCHSPDHHHLSTLQGWMPDVCIFQAGKFLCLSWKQPCLNVNSLYV